MLLLLFAVMLFFFFKQKTAYEMRISDWSSDVCSSDLLRWSRDTRNDYFMPSVGALQRASIEATLPGSTAEYYKIEYEYRSEERRVGKECVSTCRSRW